ncbi:MAG: hypothetical protein IJU23_04950 [Proteobacteria bacterium]|nr:hypothetical protein [Pseudomonadota bacterium]
MPTLKNWLRYSVCICAAVLCGVIWSSTAFADDCDTIHENPDWKSNFDALKSAYEAEDYKTALRHAKQLENICDLSPGLNYYIANIHKQKGDKEKYLYYLTKATQNTEHIAVDKNFLDKLWSEKYIAAHPDADPESIAAREATIATLTEENNALKQQLSSSISRKDSLGAQIQDYKTPMWIGTGIGAGGVVLAVVGGALVATSHPLGKMDSSAQKYDEDVSHATGWVLLGVGSGLAISGAIFAGIFGYKYRHNKDIESFAISVSPNQASIQFEF